MRAQTLAAASDLFRHVSAEKAELYRAVLDVFARAKRQYRLQLRPDEVLAEAHWKGAPPTPDEVNAALVQLRDWCNLESHPDTSRVSSLSDFYRARFLYRLSQGGEAVEAALALFVETLQRRAELQTVALEDIAGQAASAAPAGGGVAARRRQDPRDAARPGARVRELGRQRPGLHGRAWRAASICSRAELPPWPSTSAD